MNKYHGRKFRLICINLVTALSLSITLGFFNKESSTAAQNIISGILVKSNSNNSTSFNNTLTLTIKNGTIQPSNCTFSRLGDCYDDKRGIVYVWVENGTVTLSIFWKQKLQS
jgi:hypothetical protein